ncbi:extracellular solute-binding protein [Streptomyces sp. NPDC001941]|uniref:extracellular solute-binding protein n=1 Tax=Streptomyces sp. NPDC001941 TaxID=3154659 RepID=UPI00332A2646
MKNRFLACTATLVSALALSGCGLVPGGSAQDRTVSVWLMKDSVSEDFLKRFTEAYEKEHPDIALKFTFQEWTGIGAKVTTALRGENTPDLIEVGNTQVAQYAETGRLYDLTLESLRDLGAKDWLPGLAQPGSIDGAQYGIPWYAANRVVIYKKDLFAKAGITALPKTRAQWLKDTEKLNGSGSEGIYLAGQDWYTLAGFVWDEGGELAVDKGGVWQGTLDSPAALRGMDYYKELQELGRGPRDADEMTPPQSDVFAKRDIAQIIATPSIVPAVLKANPALKDQLGFFAIPGKKADRPCAVFTGGSDLIVPEKARNRGAAVEVVKALAGEKWQTELARSMSYVPNKTTLARVVEDEEATRVMAEGAVYGQATPNSAQWAEVEAQNPIKPYMTAVLRGEDPKKAAKAASERITSMLR